MALYKLPQEKYEQLQIILTEISVDEINEVLDSIFLKNKELIKKYYMEQYAGKWIFPPIRRYGVEDAEKDTQKLLELYGVTNVDCMSFEYETGYNNPAILLDNQDMTNFMFLYNVYSLASQTNLIINNNYKDVFIDEWEACLVEQTFTVYETGEIQEVISYYKEQGV